MNDTKDENFIGNQTAKKGRGMTPQFIDLNGRRDKAYENAKNHGFHEGGQSEETYKALVISELCEAMEAHRHGKWAKATEFDQRLHDAREIAEKDKDLLFEGLIKDSVEDELADTVIRILDVAGKRNEAIVLRRDMIAEDKRHVYNHTVPELLYGCMCRVVQSWALRDQLEWIWAICEVIGPDILHFVTLKMDYNSGRPYHHGKAY